MNWKPCGRNPLYEVSAAGQVRRIGSVRLLVPAMNHKQNRVGYLKLCLGRRCQTYVHQLVAEAFIGPCPAGYTVDHIDFDRYNNSAANLRYLPKPVNDFRWKDRTADGHNVWDSPYYGEQEPDESHVPISAAERELIERDLDDAGW